MEAEAAEWLCVGISMCVRDCFIHMASDSLTAYLMPWHQTPLSRCHFTQVCPGSEAQLRHLANEYILSKKKKTIMLYQHKRSNVTLANRVVGSQHFASGLRQVDQGLQTGVAVFQHHRGADGALRALQSGGQTLDALLQLGHCGEPTLFFEAGGGALEREKERCEEKDQRKEEIESDQMYGSLLEKVRKDHAHTHAHCHLYFNRSSTAVIAAFNPLTSPLA